MTTLARHPRLRAAGRLVLLAAAIGLTTWGVCLVAFSNTMRGTRLGIPIAFWGVLLGYTAIRVSGEKAVRPDSADAAAPSTALEPRASAELVRERDEATRHAFELRLEVMLRRELEQVLRTELSGLRRDVAELRGDVLDAVDGRLRMERVEITRIIGSNLAALQDDRQVSLGASSDGARVVPDAGSDHRAVRDDTVPARTALAAGGGASADDGGARYPRAAASEVGNALRRGAGSPYDGVLEPSAARLVGAAEPGFGASAVAGVPSRRPDSSPDLVAASSSESRRPAVLVSEPSPAVEAEPLTESAPTAAAEPTARADPSGPSAPAATDPSDPFASLPRLSAFRLPELPASVPQPLSVQLEANPPDVSVSDGSAPATANPAAGNGYVGRRRHAVVADDEADRDVVAEFDADRDVDRDFDADPAASSPGRHGAGSATGTGPGPAGAAGPGSSRPVAHRR